MTKSIPDLCRQLPDSEPEIRERVEEFNRAVWLAVADDMCNATQSTPDYLNSIADAKAATEAMIANGWSLFIRDWSTGYMCGMNRGTSSENHRHVEATASTMELAISAASLLAAEAMKEKR